MKRIAAVVVTGLALAIGAHADRVQAAESGLGFYLLGSKTSMAGFVPPPGTYLADYNYFYTGSADIDFSIGGVTLDGGVDADAYIKLITGMWVAPEKIFGGSAALSISVPIGWKDVSAGGVLDLFGHPIGLSFQDDGGHFGDPVLGGSLGWHEGNWHWSVGTLINVPVAHWERGDVTNIGFNRWAVDLTGALTYLDMTTGLEVSSAAGFTFNGENDTTDYKTGTEFHLEAAIMQNFSKTFGLGIQGYFYQQVTGDSGSGAKLGDFEGRVIGIGPAMNFAFQLGQTHVAGSLKYFHEFDVENRLEGDAGYLTFTMPLSASSH